MRLVVVAALCASGAALIAAVLLRDLGVGARLVLAAVGGRAAGPLAFLFAAAFALFALGGPRRSFGRAIDLASVAVVPLVALRVVGELLARLASGTVGGGTPGVLGLVVEIAAYAVGAACLVPAVAIARRGDDAAPPAAVAARAPRAAGRALAALVVAVLAIDLAAFAADPRALRPVGQGDAAIDFRLPRVEPGGAIGRDLALAELSGRPVVLDFWATWCGPCQLAMPALEQVARAHSDVAFVSVNTEGADERVAARRMADRLAPSFTLVSDDGAVATRYGVVSLPHLVVLDRRGVVVRVLRGFPGESRLAAELTAALASAGAAPR
jgi:thiol-disulfide isomerase/thioredoxin